MTNEPEDQETLGELFTDVYELAQQLAEATPSEKVDQELAALFEAADKKADAATGDAPTRDAMLKFDIAAALAGTAPADTLAALLEASKIRDAAKAAAAKIVATAEIELSHARVEAAELRAEAAAVRADAETITDNAIERAATMIKDARRDAERIVAAAEAEAYEIRTGRQEPAVSARPAAGATTPATAHSIPELWLTCEVTATDLTAWRRLSTPSSAGGPRIRYGLLELCSLALPRTGLGASSLDLFVSAAACNDHLWNDHVLKVWAERQAPNGEHPAASRRPPQGRAPATRPSSPGVGRWEAELATLLVDAISRCSWVRVQHGVSDLHIAPYRLLRTQHGWHVDGGYSGDGRLVERFLLDDIREVTVLEQTFVRPAEHLLVLPEGDNSDLARLSAVERTPRAAIGESRREHPTSRLRDAAQPSVAS